MAPLPQPTLPAALAGADDGTPDLRPDALALLRRVGGPGLVRDLVALYLSYAPARLSEAEQAAGAGDREGVRRACHALRSGAAQLGLAEVAARCAAAERGAGGEGDLATAVVAVRAAYDRAAPLLATHGEVPEGE